MRIKTCIATTNLEALGLARESLGDNAIIISSKNTGDVNSVRIVAAVNSTSMIKTYTTIEVGHEQFSDLNIKEAVKQALVFHGAMPSLSKLLSNTVAFKTLSRFSLLRTDITKSPRMLVGHPGSGKKFVAEKLYTQFKSKNFPIKEISCDTQLVGGAKHFEAITSTLGIKLVTASKVDDLRSHINLRPSAQVQIIDTTATNPYNDIEMANLRQRIKVIKAEPVLVLTAGSKPMRVADTAQLYREINIKKIIPTQMDTALRIGSILSAADSASLALCSVSFSAKVEDGLKSISSISMARLVMPHTDDSTSNQQNFEATQ